MGSAPILPDRPVYISHIPAVLSFASIDTAGAHPTAYLPKSPLNRYAIAIKAYPRMRYT